MEQNEDHFSKGVRSISNKWHYLCLQYFYVMGFNFFHQSTYNIDGVVKKFVYKTQQNEKVIAFFH